MSYEEFKAKYMRYFNLMMGYAPSQAGSSHYAEKMAKLSDEYPEWAQSVEDECV